MHFQGEIPPEKKTFESFHILQIISCVESEASKSQIHIIKQFTGDYQDKHAKPNYWEPGKSRYAGLLILAQGLVHPARLAKNNEVALINI